MLTSQSVAVGSRGDCGRRMRPAIEATGSAYADTVGAWCRAMAEMRCRLPARRVAGLVLFSCTACVTSRAPSRPSCGDSCCAGCPGCRTGWRTEPTRITCDADADRATRLRATGGVRRPGCPARVDQDRMTRAPDPRRRALGRHRKGSGGLDCPHRGADTATMTRTTSNDADGPGARRTDAPPHDPRPRRPRSPTWRIPGWCGSRPTRAARRPSR